jgi:SAM-dependent methyltransferase
MEQSGGAAHAGGRGPLAGVEVPGRFEWTRQPGIGPGLAPLADLAGRTVVEVGCGSGHNMAYLVGREHAVGTGIDHDPVKIGRARSRYGHLPGISFILGDAAETLRTFKPGSLDLCLSVFGALSFTDPRPILAAVARALRPGGLLAVTMRIDDEQDRVTVFARQGNQGI